MKAILSLIIFGLLTAGFGSGLYFFLAIFSPQVVDILGFIALYGLISGTTLSFFMVLKLAGNLLFFKKPVTWVWISHGLVQAFLLSLIVVGFLILQKWQALNLMTGLLVVLAVLILEAFNERHFRLRE